MRGRDTMIKQLLRVAGLIFLVAVCTSCPGEVSVDLIYQVQASGADNITVDIAYLRAVNDTVRVEDAAVPWQEQLTTEPEKPVYLSATSNSHEIVTVTVVIFTDGALQYFAEKGGRYVTATASGIVP